MKFQPVKFQFLMSLHVGTAALLAASSFAQDGVFLETCQKLGSAAADDVDLADLDGDGDLDAFVVNGIKPGEVWLNEGNGAFEDSGQRIVTSSLDTRSCELGDVDGDLDIDAVLSPSPQPSPLGPEVWCNDGAGNFSWSSYLTLGFGTDPCALGDVDGDSDLDALVSDWDGSVRTWSVHLNDGTGAFHLHPTAPAFAEPATGGAVLGDLDGDGDLDLLTVTPTSWIPPAAPYLSRYSNDGLGNFTFTDTTALMDIPVVTTDVVLGDLDGDGDQDALTFPSGQLLLNDGQGTFVPAWAWFPMGMNIELGDVDGDGDLDAVAASTSPYPGGSELWLNDGKGVLIQAEQVLAVECVDLVLGDLDGDSDLDLFAGNYHEDGVWLNDGPSATSTFRNGLGVNPPSFASLTPPKLGTDWESQVGWSISAISSGVVWEFVGPFDGVFLDGYEILVDPSSPYLFFHTSASPQHHVPIPCDLSLENIQVWTQGFRIDDHLGELSLVLMNALDLNVGL